MTADSADTHERIDTDVARRRILQVIGAGAGLTALSGLGGARTISSAPLRSSPAAVVQLDGQQASGDTIHPVFGFSALSPEVEPPTEPDHEVQALIREREGAPTPEFFFEPTGLAIEPGDTVRFTMTTPHHNVVAYHPEFGYTQRVPDGVPPVSGPMLPAGGYWLYTFEREGVYEMNCAPHEIFGMVTRIVVGEPAGPAAEPLPDLCAQPPEGEDENSEASAGPEPRPPEFTAYTVLTDPALAPERIVKEGSVSWNDLAPESKRLFIQPVGFPPCGDASGGGTSSAHAGHGGSEASERSTSPGDDDAGGNGGVKQGGNGKAKESR